MTELNGEALHLEFMKRRGRRAPSDCGETLPKALNPTPYDIINGEVIQREYVDRFQGFEPHRPLNLFEKTAEDEGNMTAFRRVRKTVSEPRIGNKSGRPKVPDILSKPRVPDELLNTRFYDKEFWSTTSSVAGDTASLYTLGSVEDDFEDRFSLREKQERGKNAMPKWCQDAFGKDETTGYSSYQHSRFEAPKDSSPRIDPQKYYQTRQEPERYTQTKITGESPPKYDDPVHSYRKYNRQTSDPPRLQRNIEQTYDTRRINEQRTFVLKDEGYNEPRYEKVSSSVSQAPVYKRVC